MKSKGVLASVRTVGSYAAMGISIGLYGLYTAFNFLGALALKAHTALEAWIKVPLPPQPAQPPPVPPAPPVVKVKQPKG